MKKNEMALSFFEGINWTEFYQEKMALCELIDHFQGSDDIKERNAIEWINGILEMMDAMGDTAENLGLFEYPERDGNDRCFDERFNDVLLNNPNEGV